jgi:hypothetical protein
MRSATLAAVSAVLILGCTTQRTEPPREPPASLQSSVTEANALRFDSPPDNEEFKAHFCQLGTSCMTLDPRPFEPCLLTTKHCSDKVVEPLLVEDTSVGSPTTEEQR